MPATPTGRVARDPTTSRDPAGDGSEQVDLLVENLRRPTDQADAVEERHELGAGLAHAVVVVGVVRGLGECAVSVESRVAVHVGMDHALDHEVHGHRGVDPLELQAGAARPGQPARDLLAGEPDVPGLLEDVDLADRACDRLDAFVAHEVALHHVQDLLRGHDARVGVGTPEEPAPHPAEAVDVAGRAVVRHAEAFPGPAEHDGVAALVGDLGEGELHVAGVLVTVVDVAQQHLHEQDLEPQAHARDARGLVLGQFDALFLGHLVPQRRAVQRAPLGGHAVLVGGDGGVPVDLHRRVVGLAGRRGEQALRGLLALGQRDAGDEALALGFRRAGERCGHVSTF
ncbi:hypothetical protein RHRU231_840064 [Rhodococcus ruber]|uniref:Uncharacterized protein n=1 Tax=Rhodococcus ruber TaxID=1830 RepID=A0A098BTK0_9NOCA|nr:hypothetical protein RHRU231_840064 [Rhodococcus ruber]